MPLFGDTVSRPRLVMVVDHEDMPFGTRRNFWASELYLAWTDAEGRAEFQL